MIDHARSDYAAATLRWELSRFMRTAGEPVNTRVVVAAFPHHNVTDIKRALAELISTGAVTCWPALRHRQLRAWHRIEHQTRVPYPGSPTRYARRNQQETTA